MPGTLRNYLANNIIYGAPYFKQDSTRCVMTNDLIIPVESNLKTGLRSLTTAISISDGLKSAARTLLSAAIAVCITSVSFIMPGCWGISLTGVPYVLFIIIINNLATAVGEPIVLYNGVSATALKGTAFTAA